MSKKRILIVEDEAIVAKDLAQKLGRLGYEVTGQTARGEDAVALAREERPDLVLMDIRLKGRMDGVQAAGLIRQECDIAVVYLTAHSDPATLQRAKLTEPFGYILKPFEERELEAHIEMALYKHQADRELRQQREWLSVTLNSIGDAVVTTDASGGITSLNAVAEELTGWTKAEALHRPFGEVLQIVDEQSGQPAPDLVAGVLKEGKVVELASNMALVTRAGRRRAIEDSAAPIKDSRGRVLGVVMVFRDVTERKRMEGLLRQAQKMEAIGHLTGGMAHHFNNILAGMMLAFGLIPGTKDPNDLADLLEGLEASCNRAAGLIKQLLAFGRQSVMKLQPTDLGAMVLGQIETLKESLGAGILVEFAGPPIALRVKADKTLMEQVILNLCLNARDAMKAGGRLGLSVTGEVVEEERSKRILDARAGPFVCLSVSDTGCGMDARALERLFEPFFTTKKVGQGTGLGLATVRGIIQQHQGWIEVESRLGEGTTFRIYLPVDETTRVVAPVAPSETEVRTGTILVVEDEPMLRRLTRAVLVKNGYHVLEAADASEALAVWADQRSAIDLIFTDMVMPGELSGLQLGQRAMAEKPVLKVIITSGYNTDQVDLENLEKASIVCLPKPCPPGRLLEVIGKCLRPEAALMKAPTGHPEGN